MTDIELAERLGRRRARMLPVLAILFITQQTAYFSGRTGGAGEALRSVDQVRIGAWLVLSVVLLLALTTGGSWFRSRGVRDLMNDEVTRANRAAAMQLGFITAMLGAFTLYLVNQVAPVSANDAIHLIVTIGIATALLRFGMLERRAHRGG